ncbi:hypothetical protein RUND412_007471 [Rhizina undulata]
MDFNDDPEQSFYHRFQHEHIELDAAIEQLSNLQSSKRTEAIDHCLSRISRLSDVVKDASSYLPAYDQRSYSEQVKALSDKLSETRKALAPKQKFSFKSKKKDTATSGIGGAVKTSSSAPSKASPNEGHASTKAENLEISSQSSSLILPPINPINSSSSLLLSNLDRCIVSLASRPYSFSSGAIKNISSSLLFLGGAINGPLHITSISNSILVVSCRQFRMHEAKNVDVYLLCPSRPIIEDCTGIRFAPLPEIDGIAINSQLKNLWDQVDDFKWLKSEQSPNWESLPKVERVEGKAWMDILNKAHGEMGVEETLGAVLRRK